MRSRTPTRPSATCARGGSRAPRCSSWTSTPPRYRDRDDATACRAALLGRLPLAPAGALRPARGDGRARPRPRHGRRARGRHRRARRPRALRRLAHDPDRRRGRRTPRRRADRPDVPRLPPARRPLLPHPGPGDPPRRPRERHDQEHSVTTIAIGESAPSFALPDTDGAEQALEGSGEAAAPATVVVFTCNHCPYALAWHDRLLAVARDYADSGVRMLLINPNDAERYPRDSMEAMQARVHGDGGWPAPYLRDEDQSVARAYGAKTTPDVFVVAPDGAIAYRGAPDARPRSPPGARPTRPPGPGPGAPGGSATPGGRYWQPGRLSPPRPSRWAA